MPGSPTSWIAGVSASNANLLQLVISDPWFAWLHSVSELIVRIDETVEPGRAGTESDGIALVEQVEKLLTASETRRGVSAAILRGAAAAARGRPRARRRAAHAQGSR